MARGQLSPVGAVIKGAIAGTIGTAAMDGVWFARARKDGSESSFLEYESSSGIDDWEDAPAPAELGKRLAEAFLQKELSAKEWGATINNVMHWGYGAVWGAIYGLTAGSTDRRRVTYGVPFGAAVWGSAYVLLPAADLYKPITEYDAKTLWKDLSAHLAYGVGTALAFRILSGTDIDDEGEH